MKQMFSSDMQTNARTKRFVKVMKRRWFSMSPAVCLILLLVFVVLKGDVPCVKGPHENRPPYYVLAFIMRVQ